MTAGHLWDRELDGPLPDRRVLEQTLPPPPPPDKTSPPALQTCAKLWNLLVTSMMFCARWRQEEMSEGRAGGRRGWGGGVGWGGQKREKARTQKTRPFVNQSKQGFNLMLWLGALCFADGLKMSMWWVLWEWCLPRSSTRWALQAAAARLGMSVHSRSSVAQTQARTRRRGQHYSGAVPVLGAFGSAQACARTFLELL